MNVLWSVGYSVVLVATATTNATRATLGVVLKGTLLIVMKGTLLIVLKGTGTPLRVLKGTLLTVLKCTLLVLVRDTNTTPARTLGEATTKKNSWDVTTKLKNMSYYVLRSTDSYSYRPNHWTTQSRDSVVQWFRRQTSNSVFCSRSGVVVL